MSISRADVRAAVRYALILIAVYFIQAELLPHVRIIRMTPVLLPLAAVAFAMWKTPEKAGVFGLFAGMLCDVSFNEPVIKFTLLLTVVSVIVPLLCDTVLSRSFPAFFVMSAAVLVLSAFIQALSLIFVSGQSVVSLAAGALWQTLYSLIFTVPVWFVVKRAADGRRR